MKDILLPKEKKELAEKDIVVINPKRVLRIEDMGDKNFQKEYGGYCALMHTVKQTVLAIGNYKKSNKVLNEISDLVREKYPKLKPGESVLFIINVPDVLHII